MDREAIHNLLRQTIDAGRGIALDIESLATNKPLGKGDTQYLREIQSLIQASLASLNILDLATRSGSIVPIADNELPQCLFHIQAIKGFYEEWAAMFYSRVESLFPLEDGIFSDQRIGDPAEHAHL